MQSISINYLLSGDIKYEIDANSNSEIEALGLRFQSHFEID